MKLAVAGDEGLYAFLSAWFLVFLPPLFWRFRAPRFLLLAAGQILVPGHDLSERLSGLVGHHGLRSRISHWTDAEGSFIVRPIKCSVEKGHGCRRIDQTGQTRFMDGYQEEPHSQPHGFGHIIVLFNLSLRIKRVTLCKYHDQIRRLREKRFVDALPRGSSAFSHCVS